MDEFLQKLRSFLSNHADFADRLQLEQRALDEGMVAAYSITVDDEHYWLEISEA